MRLVRPHVPFGVKVQVIARQLQECGQLRDVLAAEVVSRKLYVKLHYMLRCMFGEHRKLHLDHDPALVLRHFDETTGKYDPDANDPAFLTYRTVEDHRRKTFVRGDGAQFSDAAKRRRKIKSERQDRPHPNRWPPKGSRKLQSRSSW